VCSGPSGVGGGGVKMGCVGLGGETVVSGVGDGGGVVRGEGGYSRGGKAGGVGGVRGCRCGQQGEEGRGCVGGFVMVVGRVVKGRVGGGRRRRVVGGASLGGMWG